MLLKTLKAEKTSFPKNNFAPKLLITEELSRNEFASCYPVKPQYLVNIIREVMADDEIVLADTGAVKMWMARLYPTYEPNTCLISNGLATMSFALPGAVGANFAVPDKKILAVMGDGSFIMNSQEIETAVRENIPLKILIWEDYCYGMIKLEMDRVMDTDNNIRFSNPDFVKYAESFGAHGYKVKSAESLKETLYQAINEEGVSIVICPVDYSENMKLTRKLSAISKSNLRI